jgi:putative endonuclease
MFYAYVIKSIQHDYYYKGHCQDLQKRLLQHNSGMTLSLKPYIPFEIVYFEEFETENEAILQEKYFKTSAGRRYLKKKDGLVVQCPPGRPPLFKASTQEAIKAYLVL